eukprot:c18355_g1_i1 orf=320-1180(-)
MDRERSCSPHEQRHFPHHPHHHAYQSHAAAASPPFGFQPCESQSVWPPFEAAHHHGVSAYVSGAPAAAPCCQGPPSCLPSGCGSGAQYPLSFQEDKPICLPEASPHAFPGKGCASVGQEFGYKPACSTDSKLLRGQLVKIFCKSDRNFSLAVLHGGVVMVPADSQDETQQWIKDDSPGIHVKDVYGFPAFFLVNKACRKAVKFAKEKGQQVLLVDYQPGISGDDILLTASQDFGEGYKTIRSATDTLLNMTVFQGDKRFGGLRNGSPIVLDTWHKQEHQLWKIHPL